MSGPRQSWLACLIALACLPGCGDSEDACERPSPFGSGPAAPLSKDIKFISEIGRKSYPEATAPEPAPLLNWDFSKKQAHVYDYVQKAVNRSNMMGGLADTDQSIDGTLSLLVRSKGDGTATVVMKDTQMSMTVDGEKKAMRSNFPPMAVQGMKEDGSMRTGNSSTELLLKMLSPLPTKPLKPGESVALPASMPFNIMGSVLEVTGTATVTLTGYVSINGRTCARLDTDIDISKLDVPEDLEGSYECFAKGKSVSYFDVQARSFVNLELAMTMAFSTETPSPKIEMDDEAGPDMPDTMEVSMQVNTLIRVSRNAKKTAAENK
jgi:hypothetical protein